MYFWFRIECLHLLQMCRSVAFGSRASMQIWKFIIICLFSTRGVVQVNSGIFRSMQFIVICWGLLFLLPWLIVMLNYLILPFFPTSSCLPLFNKCYFEVFLQSFPIFVKNTGHRGKELFLILIFLWHKFIAFSALVFDKIVTLFWRSFNTDCSLQSANPKPKL